MHRSQGRTFTGTWFSTLSTHVQRVRGYVGRPDASTFFSEPKRWAACQKWEEPRRPWYMPVRKSTSTPSSCRSYGDNIASMA